MPHIEIIYSINGQYYTIIFKLRLPLVCVCGWPAFATGGLPACGLSLPRRVLKKNSPHVGAAGIVGVIR
jgi:hypothetical protein